MTVRTITLAFAFSSALSAPAVAEPVRTTPVMDISQQWAGYWNAKNLKTPARAENPLTLRAPSRIMTVERVTESLRSGKRLKSSDD